MVSLVAFGALVFLIADSHTRKVASICGDYRNDKSVKISNENLNAEVASTVESRNRGLSGRPCILPNQAMLFVFETPNQYKMWMKDMKFPIDIIWISADHKAVAVERDVKPSTYPDLFANRDKPAEYVIEMKANRSSELGINLGTPINF